MYFLKRLAGGVSIAFPKIISHSHNHSELQYQMHLSLSPSLCFSFFTHNSTCRLFLSFLSLSLSPSLLFLFREEQRKGGGATDPQDEERADLLHDEADEAWDGRQQEKAPVRSPHGADQGGPATR